jgi:hypothetical protein
MGRLFVEDGISMLKAVADQSAWADLVIHPTYQLRQLSEVKSFIQKHKHLPNVPRKEVIKKGSKFERYK